MFFHGGAWRLLSKAESAYPAMAMIEQGISFAAVNFDLVPAISLAEQVAQCQRAIAWLSRNAGDREAANMTVLGHSSGAHLAAMMATTDWQAEAGLPANVIKSALLVSGVYDLEPVRLSARNDYLHLDEQTAKALSPIQRVGPSQCPVAVTWGGRELEEFQRQSEAFSQAWRRAGNQCETLPYPSSNHFEMSFRLAETDDAVYRALCKLVLS